MDHPSAIDLPRLRLELRAAEEKMIALRSARDRATVPAEAAAIDLQLIDAIVECSTIRVAHNLAERAHAALPTRNLR